MSDGPTISVVIPTASPHRESQLVRCVESVQRCVFPHDELEIVVVLDGGNPDEYRQLRDVDPPFRVVVQHRAGRAAARNTGWRASSGEIVAFLDDDSVVGNEWFADVESFFRRHRDVAGVGGLVEPIHPGNVVNRMVRDMGHRDHQLGPFGWRLTTTNAAFRRSALEAVGGFDQRFTRSPAEDLDLCDRLGRGGFELRTVRGALVYHYNPQTVREMLAMARRNQSATSKRGRSLGRRVLAVDLPPRGALAVERVVYGAPYVRCVPMWYRKARRSCPNAFFAIGEAVLELLWQSEFARPGGAHEPDPTDGALLGETERLPPAPRS